MAMVHSYPLVNKHSYGQLHFLWVNPLSMAIFTSYFDTTRGYVVLLGGSKTSLTAMAGEYRGIPAGNGGHVGRCCKDLSCKGEKSGNVGFEVQYRL